MEGTHKPINVPSSLSPWKYSISEKINDNSAATISSLSEVVNLLSMGLKSIVRVKDRYKAKDTHSVFSYIPYLLGIGCIGRKRAKPQLKAVL